MRQEKEDEGCLMMTRARVERAWYTHNICRWTGLLSNEDAHRAQPSLLGSDIRMLSNEQGQMRRGKGQGDQGDEPARTGRIGAVLSRTQQGRKDKNDVAYWSGEGRHSRHRRRSWPERSSTARDGKVLQKSPETQKAENQKAEGVIVVPAQSTAERRRNFEVRRGNEGRRIDAHYIQITEKIPKIKDSTLEKQRAKLRVQQRNSETQRRELGMKESAQGGCKIATAHWKWGPPGTDCTFGYARAEQQRRDGWWGMRAGSGEYREPRTSHSYSSSIHRTSMDPSSPSLPQGARVRLASTRRAERVLHEKRVVERSDGRRLIGSEKDPVGVAAFWGCLDRAATPRPRPEAVLSTHRDQQGTQSQPAALGYVRASVVTAIVQHLIHQILKFFIEGGHGINFTLASATAYKKRRERQAVTKQLRNTVAEIENRIGARLFELLPGCISMTSRATPAVPGMKQAVVPRDATATDVVRAGAGFGRSSDRIYETIAIEYDSE
ncbi:hypothetical protein C8R45DRAFT_1070018 [Mycena sanguinolenta]|nr:hypothetical protein C8R45DRAFT_1070018 [Mycena sanguinolenta]